MILASWTPGNSDRRPKPFNPRGPIGAVGLPPVPGRGSGAVLELQDVGVRFGGIVALDGVDLEVRSGEVCGLIGPNGAGKTTLFDVISGVRLPNSGRVRFDGLDITHWPAVARARGGVRRTFQRVQPYGWLTVGENVLAGLEWRGGGGGMLADLVAFPYRRAWERERWARVEEVLEQCSLTRVRNELPLSLPIGLTRMVELARAIVDSPRLLLLDEPTSGLDHAECERLAERIRAVRDSSDCSVLVVEHDVGFVMDICDRVVVLERGHVLATGSPQEIQSDTRVRAAYLG
jgi:branched-chain amino acid transport system ATP-binding protein